MPGCTASPALHFLDYYQVFHPSDLKREPRNSSNASVKNKTPRNKKKKKQNTTKTIPESTEHFLTGRKKCISVLSPKHN